MCGLHAAAAKDLNIQAGPAARPQSRLRRQAHACQTRHGGSPDMPGALQGANAPLSRIHEIAGATIAPCTLAMATFAREGELATPRPGRARARHLCNAFGHRTVPMVTALVRSTCTRQRVQPAFTLRTVAAPHAPCLARGRRCWQRTQVRHGPRSRSREIHDEMRANCSVGTRALASTTVRMRAGAQHVTGA